MSEFWRYLRQMNLRALFLDRTGDTFIQFFRYLFVGGAAFVADAGALWLLGQILHYLAAAAIAFVFGLAVNFALTKLFVFKQAKLNAAAEFAVFAAIGVIGLGLTELIMYVLTDIAGLYYIISKIIASAVVLIWNFAARKIVLYGRDDK